MNRALKIIVALICAIIIGSFLLDVFSIYDTGINIEIYSESFPQEFKIDLGKIFEKFTHNGSPHFNLVMPESEFTRDKCVHYKTFDENEFCQNSICRFNYTEAFKSKLKEFNCPFYTKTTAPSRDIYFSAFRMKSSIIDLAEKYKLNIKVYTFHSL